MVPRCCESASSSSGDADWRGHHEEGRSLSEDHPTLLCGHADHVHPPLYPSLLHGMPHTESLRGQLLPDRTVWVSDKSGVFLLHLNQETACCKTHYRPKDPKCTTSSVMFSKLMQFKFGRKLFAFYWTL